MTHFVLIDGPTDTVVAEMFTDSPEQAVTQYDNKRDLSFTYTRAGNPPYPPAPGFEVFTSNATVSSDPLDLDDPKVTDKVREQMEYHCTLLRMPVNHSPGNQSLP